MLYEREMSIVQQILDDVGLPSPWQSPDDFMRESYYRWAAVEYLDRLCAASERLPSYLTGIEPPSAKDIFDELWTVSYDFYRETQHPQFKVPLNMLRHIEDRLGFAKNTQYIMEETGNSVGKEPTRELWVVRL